MWLIVLQVFLSVVLVSRGENICILQDFVEQSNGLFSKSCGGLRPLSVEKYEDSDIPMPEGSNGYFLTTPVHTDGSCIATDGNVNVVSGTEMIFKYYSKGQAGYCLALIRSKLFTNIAQIPVDDARYWRTFSVTIKSTTSLNIEIKCNPMGEAKLAIDSITFKTIEECPTLESPVIVCHKEEFGNEDTGIFFDECPGWTSFFAGSYKDFLFPRPENSNGFFASSQQSVFGSCMKTKETIYMDGDTETLFKYYVYGNSTKCILSLVKGGEILASETILMNNAQEWKTLSLAVKDPALVSIVAQCGGSKGGKLLIDSVSVKSTSGNCEGNDASRRDSNYLLYNVIST